MNPADDPSYYETTDAETGSPVFRAKRPVPNYGASLDSPFAEDWNADQEDNVDPLTD